MAKAPPQTSDSAAPAPPGGKKKLLLIGGVVVLLLLLGAGAAAFFLFGGEPTEEEGEAAAAVEEDPGEPTYYKLDPEFVVNLPPGGKAKLLQVGLEVFTTDPDITAVLERHAPMLRHHLFDVLSSHPADELFTRAGREQLQKELQEELRNKLVAVGETNPNIKAVYFTQFVLQ